jgi:hypothetical protein
MAIVSELYYYHYIKNSGLSEFEIMTIYAGMILIGCFYLPWKRRYDVIVRVISMIYDTKTRNSKFIQKLYF